MFLRRALVAGTLGPLLLYLVYEGNWLYFIPITALVTLAAHEYANIMRAMERNTPIWLLLPSVWVLFWGARHWDYEANQFALFIIFFVTLCYALWLYERGNTKSAVADWMALLGGIVILGWVASHFIWLRELNPASGSEMWKWTALTFITAWGADSFAYLVGTFLAGRFIFGRHKLTPRLSPNKTVEGYIGGILLGTLFSVCLGVFIFDLQLNYVFQLSLIISITSTAGDLGISLLKREAGVKDSGVLFPGHGGALDRIDSLIWCMALAFYYINYFTPLFN